MQPLHYDSQHYIYDAVPPLVGFCVSPHPVLAPSSVAQHGKQSKSACNAQRVANSIPGATLTGNNTFQGGHEEFGSQVSGADLAGAGFSFYSSPFGNGNGYRTPFNGGHVNGQPGDITVPYAYGETFAGLDARRLETLRTIRYREPGNIHDFVVDEARDRVYLLTDHVNGAITLDEFVLSTGERTRNVVLAESTLAYSPLWTLDGCIY